MPLSDHIPKGEALRFLIAGGSNTLFGIADTFFFTWLFTHALPARLELGITLATLIATVTNITVSFLTYKWFVFRTEGNYLQEYARSFVVYGPSLLLTLALAPLLATILKHALPRPSLAPYAAQACIIAVAIVPQFLGHKKFTFRKKVPPPALAASTEESI